LRKTRSGVMLVLLLCLSFVGFACRTQIARSAPSVLTNGDFETGTLNGWNVLGTCAISSTIVHSGSYSAYVSDVGYDNWVSQELNLPAGNDYHFEGWIYPLKVGNLGPVDYPASFLYFWYYNKSSMLPAFHVNYVWCWNDWNSVGNGNYSSALEFLLPFNQLEWNLLSINLTEDVRSYFVGIDLSQFILHSVTAQYHYSNGSPGAFYVDDISLSARVPYVNGTIFIRDYGSVDQSTAPISTVDNITYTFANNINGSIVVQKDSIVLDGAGYTLQGPGSGEGIELFQRTNVTVRNTQITAFDYGIALGFSSENTISNNNLTANHFGIDLSFSHRNIIFGDTVTGTIGYASIHLVNSASNSIFGNNVTANCFDGIWLDSSSNNLISGNNLSANGSCGIEFWGSSFPFGSDYNTISKNDISFNNGVGISLSHSSNSSIFENNLTANSGYGIYLYSSFGNSVSRNNLTANNLNIGIGSSSSNMICHNNLVDNGQQVSIEAGSVNAWDNGYPYSGSYWSDYNGTDLFRGPYQNETGGDGIGDTHYIIDSNNTDNYPLMQPWRCISGDVNGDGTVDIYDAILLSGAFNSQLGSAKWNPNADINGDGIVDIYDAIILSGHFNQHYP